MIRSIMLDASTGRRAETSVSAGLESYRLRAQARIRGWSAARHARWLGPIAALCLALCLAGPARSSSAQRAQTAVSAAATSGRPTPDADARAAARAHFDAALEHYRAHDYREAIREFELSLAAVPNADIWFDIGRAHEQLGELSEAIESYRRYLRDRVDATDAAALRARIAALEGRRDAERAARAARALPSTGSLAIEANQPGVEVQLDGQALGTAPLQRVVAVEPGAHRVSARKASHAPFLARIDVQPGAVSAAYVRLTPLQARAPVAASHVASIVLAGASAAALLTGTGLALASGAERNARDVPPSDAIDRAGDLAAASRVSFAAALGLAAGAMLAYVIEGSVAGGDVDPHARAHEAAMRARAAGF
jgi:tetratricopeptide (TPR) repeat protein